MSKISNSTLADKIVAKHATAEKADLGWIVDITSSVGIKHLFVKTVKDTRTINSEGDTEEYDRPTKTTKAEALALASEYLASELDAGNIDISDEWIKKNV